MNHKSLDVNGFTNEPMQNNLTVTNTNIFPLNELKISITQNINIKIVANVNGLFNCSTECLILKQFNPNDVIYINFDIKTNVALYGQLPIEFSSGNTYRTVIISLNVKNRNPKVTLSPSSLDFTILGGENKYYELTLTNTGNIDSYKLNLTLPIIQNGYLKLVDLQINNSDILNSNNFDLPLQW